VCPCGVSRCAHVTAKIAWRLCTRKQRSAAKKRRAISTSLRLKRCLVREARLLLRQPCVVGVELSLCGVALRRFAPLEPNRFGVGRPGKRIELRGRHDEVKGACACALGLCAMEQRGARDTRNWVN
jgi:hypothetical protein